MSKEDCMRMSVSILIPKAFSMRRAISPERLALPFRRLDKAGRETCSAGAASVTDRPAGSMISVRMKSPGCGGFFMGMVGCSCVSVVIFQIYVADFALGGVNAKRQTAVTGNAQAPCAFAVTGQCVHLPCRKRAQLLRVAHIVKEAEHLAHLLRGIGWHALRAVFRVEPLQALVGEIPYFHRQSVACSLTLIKPKMQCGGRKGPFVKHPRRQVRRFASLDYGLLLCYIVAQQESA